MLKNINAIVLRVYTYNIYRRVIYIRCAVRAGGNTNYHQLVINYFVNSSNCNLSPLRNACFLARASKMLQTQQLGARACSPREFALQREYKNVQDVLIFTL